MNGALIHPPRANERILAKTPNIPQPTESKANLLFFISKK